MKYLARLGIVMGATTVLAAGCSANVDVFGEGGSGGNGGADNTNSTSTNGPTTATGTTTSSTSSVSTSTSSTMSSNVSTSTGMGCPSGPNDDDDMDGWTPSQGDCDDCDPEIGPHAFEIPGNNIDDNCSGATDELPMPCDGALTINTDNPVFGAQAMGMCKLAAAPNEWGVSSIAWVQADGSAPPANPQQLAAFHIGHGMLSDFGPNNTPREGARMLAISTGSARDAADPGYDDPSSSGKGYSSPHAPGMPKEAVECPTADTGTCNDSIALQIAINVPTNARGLSYLSNLFVHDFPDFVCSTYNDTFFTLMLPAPMGFADGQIGLYANGNPISLNGAPFDVCSCAGGPPCMAGGKSFACAQGDLRLLGTGFEGHGATGWQRTTAPVAPGSQIVLRLGVFDAADGIMTATTLLDDFRWSADPNTVVATVPAP